MNRPIEQMVLAWFLERCGCGVVYVEAVKGEWDEEI